MNSIVSKEKPVKRGRNLVYAWHFLHENGKTRWNNIEVKPGEQIVHDGKIELCESGLHASIKLNDALYYAPGPILCRVKCEGRIINGNDKIVCTRRTVLWMFDASRVLRLWACWCIRNTKLSDGRTVWDLLTDERSRKAVEVAEKYAVGEVTIEEMSAARSAAGAAWSAAWSAADAARSAAWSAADVAWSAARSAADAAWSAARNAADADWSAADAARSAAAAKLQKMVIEESKRLGIWIEEEQ